MGVASQSDKKCLQIRAYRSQGITYSYPSWLGKYRHTVSPRSLLLWCKSLLLLFPVWKSPLCLESFQVTQVLPGEKSLPKGKSLQVILASLWKFPSGCAFLFLMRGWKINGCVLRSVCQQMPGLAECCNEASPHCAAQMLRLAESKPAQVPLLSALPVDAVGTCSHSSPFASRALGAVTSNQRQWGVLREAVCSSASKIWRSLCYSQHRDRLQCYHTLLPGERAAVKQMVSTGNFLIVAALNPTNNWAASLRLCWNCHCRKKSDRLKH